MSLYGFQKIADLRFAQWLYLLMVNARHGGSVRRIESDIADSYGLLEGLVKYPVDVTDRKRRLVPTLAAPAVRFIPFPQRSSKGRKKFSLQMIHASSVQTMGLGQSSYPSSV